jgi:hypothetical protein
MKQAKPKSAASKGGGGSEDEDEGEEWGFHDRVCMDAKHGTG